MKKHFYKPFYCLIAILMAFSTLHAQGTDAFGYTWKASTAPDGPVFNWIDITTVGTQLTGMGDDNSVGMFPMGMDFHFYWSDYDKVKIGSNGWISFNNVSNIASCFPNIPTPDTRNNLICPLMSDLNFDNGSTGKVYTYHDQTPGDEKYIVSYIGVPFFTTANPIFGSNTFQIILSKADSSITFQYLNMTADFTYNCTGAGKVAVGIENITGDIGLQPFAGSIPPSNSAIKFYYPQVVTFSIVDAAPTSNQNDANEGVFVVPEMPLTLTSTISNTGNTGFDSDIIVGATVRSFETGATVFSDVQGISKLAIGQVQTLSFDAGEIDWDPGTYYYDVQTDNNDDVNPGNDLNITEIDVVDISGERTALGYVTGVTPAGVYPFNGGIEIEPPFYPAKIVALEVFIAGNSTAGFTLRLFDDDGPNGGIGSELLSEPIPPGGYQALAWNQYELENPVTITEGSFFLGWYADGTPVGMLTETVGPLSNRAYEIVSDVWAKSRTNSDLMLRAIVENPLFVGTDDLVNDSRLEVYPNPNNATFHIDNSLGDVQIENIRLMNPMGAVVFEQKQTIPAGQQWKVQTGAPAGLYYLELKTAGSKRIVRKVVVE